MTEYMVQLASERLSRKLILGCSASSANEWDGCTVLSEDREVRSRVFLATCVGRRDVSVGVVSISFRHLLKRQSSFNFFSVSFHTTGLNSSKLLCSFHVLTTHGLYTYVFWQSIVFKNIHFAKFPMSSMPSVSDLIPKRHTGLLLCKISLSLSIYIYICVCMYMCMYVCMYVLYSPVRIRKTYISAA